MFRLTNMFGQMVHQKRRKMLMLVLFLIFVPFLSQNVNATINLTYIVKKDRDNKLLLSCIAEELERYAAIGWVYPLPSGEEQLPNITEKFIPSMPNDFNCNFSKNNICNIRWMNKDWKIDDNSSRTRDFLGDERWQELPTIITSNSSKEFEQRFDIEGIDRIGFSVRTAGPVEIFLCTGWNPYNYPCYEIRLSINETILFKFPHLPKENMEIKSEDATKHEVFNEHLLSPYEWRNFLVNFVNGSINLVDLHLNKVLFYVLEDGDIKPTYFLIRSQTVALWKISQNNFIYTKTTQISRLGPQLSISNKDLCVSLLVSTCAKCEMQFFYLNGIERKLLKNVASTNEEWLEIKLKEENVNVEKVNIFVETKMSSNENDNETQEIDAFWAVDNVRVCNENEVRVTHLKLNETYKSSDDITDENISCQLIGKPSWRPRKLTYDQIKDFPEINVLSNSSSIKLSWNEEDLQHEINYFIAYQANDICPDNSPNLRRLKSNGFVSTKFNEILIGNLIPFTIYNITVSTVLHEYDKVLSVHTLESDEIELGEYPTKIQMRPSDTELYVSWEKPSCVWRYGRLIYTLTITNQNLNFTKKIELQTENSYKIEGLTPFTPYSLTILTARNARKLTKGIDTNSIELNFTTKPGVAGEVENLEIYAIGSDYASLRYNLPNNTNGYPTDIQVSKCNALSFKKCKIFTAPVQRCYLWPQKYCVDVRPLITNQEYAFRVSLKNRDTASFGKEVIVNGDTVEHVPAPPANVTYKIVDCQKTTDYCHLNITWSHPNNQNGTITAFNIILNSSNTQMNSEEYKNIHEMYKVTPNFTYLPIYTYQIKYVPYSANYDLYIQSNNMKYHSDFVKTNVKTDEIGEHIDQSPKLLGKSDSALIFRLPHLDSRLDAYTLAVVVQDFDAKKQIPDSVRKKKKINDNLCHNFGNTWTSEVVKVKNNDTQTVTIATSLDGKEHIQPETKYCIIFIITNKYKDTEHDVVYYEKLETPATPTSPKSAGDSDYKHNHLYMLFLLILLVPVGFLIYRYVRKRNLIRKPAESDNENVYESLPFDDNCVSNENYDKLQHK